MPEPKKEEAPHKKVPNPEKEYGERKEGRPEGIYDEPTKPKPAPVRSPGESGPTKVPGIGGIFQGGSQEQGLNIEGEKGNTPTGKGLNTFAYTQHDKDVERGRVIGQQWPKDPRDPQTHEREIFGDPHILESSHTPGEN